MTLTFFNPDGGATFGVIFDRHARALFDDKWHTAMIAVSAGRGEERREATLFVDCGFDGMCADCLYMDTAYLVS